LSGERPVRLFLTYLVLIGVTLSPLLWVSIPPLVDYPSHLGRMSILAAPVASQNYLVRWQWVPNLAMDLVVPPLGAIVGLERAGRVFIALTLLLLVAATTLLHRVLWGRVGWWPSASFLFLYNRALYYGFLNYLFGLGMALLCFAFWIALRNRWVPARPALFSVLASVIFLLHLFAFGVYGLLILSYETGRLWSERPVNARKVGRFLAAFLQFVPAAGFWLANASVGGGQYTGYGDLVDKLVAALAPANFSVVGSMLAPLLAAFAGLAWWRGALRLAPAMRWPVLTIFAAAAAMPNWLYGSWGADLRLPVALAFVFIAATEPRVSRRWVAGLVAAGCVGLLVVRIAAITAVWRAMDQRFAEFRTAARTLPEGARLLVAQSPMPEAQRRIDGVPLAVAALDPVAFRHMGDLAVLDRDAFVPTFEMQLSLAFEQRLGPIEQAPRNLGRYPQQGLPLRLDQLRAGAGRDPATPPALPGSPAERPGEIPYWVDWPDKFEYLLVIDFGEPVPGLPKYLQISAQGSFFTLYRITPG
jgi:hypothetical protein